MDLNQLIGFFQGIGFFITFWIGYNARSIELRRLQFKLDSMEHEMERLIRENEAFENELKRKSF